MNLSNRLREECLFPGAAFKTFPEEYEDYATYGPDPDPGAISYQHQGGVAEWRIDGASYGVQFWIALPSMAPNGIILKVPDQLEWPADCRNALGARDSVHMLGGRAAQLGISHHLRKSLQHWTSQNPNFEQEFLELPFGSHILVPKITTDISLMEFRLVPNDQLQDQLFSIKALQQIWGLIDMPPVIPLESLLLVRQIHKSISLVKIAGDDTGKLWIFKSRSQVLGPLYHELKLLLTISPHPSIIERPQYLITRSSKSHEESSVYGFLLKFHEAGALQEVLPQRLQSESLALVDQLRWAQEITTGLIHLQKEGQFHSDLKPDNILLTSSGGVVLTDFEQGRNLWNYAAPEIYYVEWIAELGDTRFARSSTSPETRERVSVLKRYLQSKDLPSLPTQSATYDNPEHGWYFPWLLSTPEEREKAHVYGLGKLLWCIFEGVGDADNVLGRSIPFESEQRFPEFQRTPVALRSLIERCTKGAREWTGGPISIFRNEGTVFPLGKTGRNGEPKGTLEETKEAITRFWGGEVEKAVDFVEAKLSYERGEANKTQRALLSYLDRPKLEVVLSELDLAASLVVTASPFVT